MSAVRRLDPSARIGNLEFVAAVRVTRKSARRQEGRKTRDGDRKGWEKHEAHQRDGNEEQGYRPGGAKAFSVVQIMDHGEA